MLTFLLGIFSMQLGSTLNINTMAKNHDKMPVWCLTDPKCDFTYDPDHVKINSQTKSIITSDIFPLYYTNRFGIHISGEASIGDALVWLGLAITVFTPIIFIFYFIFLLAERVYNCLL